MKIFLSFKDVSYTDQYEIYDAYRNNMLDDSVDFEVFYAMFKNYSYHYVKNLYPAD